MATASQMFFLVMVNLSVDRELQGSVQMDSSSIILILLLTGAVFGPGLGLVEPLRGLGEPSQDLVKPVVGLGEPVGLG